MGVSGISLCDTCSNCECVFQSGVVREQCDFYKKKTQHKDEYYQAIIDVLEIIDGVAQTSFAADDYNQSDAGKCVIELIRQGVIALTE